MGWEALFSFLIHLFYFIYLFIYLFFLFSTSDWDHTYVPAYSLHREGGIKFDVMTQSSFTGSWET